MAKQTGGTAGKKKTPAPTKFQLDATVLKAFSDESRLMILDLLKSGELCAQDLLAELPINQSTLSHHMKVLCQSGVVESYKNGKWTYYSVNPEGVRHALGLMEAITAPETTVLTVEGAGAAEAAAPGKTWLL